MRTSRLLSVSLCLLLAALAAQPAGAFGIFGKGPKGSGDLETRTLDLPAFDSLSVGAAFKTDVRIGDTRQVSFTIDDNLWDNLDATVANGRLTVDWKESCRPDKDCRIEIVVPSLKEMEIDGAAQVKVHDFAGEKFSFRVSGAAQLDMDGKVDDLEIEVSGAGDIDARDLDARNVTIDMSGAGKAKVTATESIDAEVSGVGSIGYWGHPERKHTSVSGLGKITAH